MYTINLFLKNHVQRKKSYEDSCVMPTYSLRPLTTESESLFWVSFAKERTDSLTTLIA